MIVPHTNPLSSALAKPLGKRSMSSGLAIVLKVARVVLAIAFAFTAVGAVFGISVSILVATHVLHARVLNGPSHNVLGTWTIAVPYLIYAVIATRGALLIVQRLQSVFASFVANDPFARDNAAHLRAIWVTLIVIEAARMLAYGFMHGLTNAFASTAAAVFPQALDNPVDLVRLFVIFVVLILAEVFRQGTLLREETELTV